MQDLTGGGKRYAAGQYRADIDGLRAIAVLAVLLHHVQLRAPGGFVGVDVFFVISGYLISGVILRELREERFSLVRFYERRVRRIAPALVVLLAATTAVAAWFMAPPEFVAYAKSLVAAVFSCSNVLFARQSGYFAEDANLKPLLHTWSLGVEEQFYLVFPLLLMAVWRWMRHRMRLVVLTGCVVSLIAACVWMQFDAVAAFYEAPLRAWELLLGVIAGERYVRLPSTKAGREVGAVLGLVLVLWPMVAYTAEMPFPGLTALPPSLGAALLLASGDGEHRTRVARMLAWRPLVFIGLISYSLYLWHWPLWVFQRSDMLLVEALETSHKAKLVVVLVSLALAAFSWRLVEQPFRCGRWMPRRRVLFALAGGAAVLLVGTGVSIEMRRGWPERFSPAALSIAEVASYDRSVDVRSGSCFLGIGVPWGEYSATKCMPEEGKPKVLLAGDSTAAWLHSALAKEVPEWTVWQMTAANCLFVVDPRQASQGPNGKTCRAMTQFFFEEELRGKGVQRVLLCVHWNGTNMQALGETIQWMKRKGIRVTVLGPPMEYDLPLAHLLFLEEREAKPFTARGHWIEEARRVDQQMKALARDVWDVEYVSEFDLFCGHGDGMDPATGCPLFAAPGVPLKSDRFHFSMLGDAQYARRLRNAGVLH